MELKGHLLVASPSLVDPNFVQSVVLMLEHSDEGAAGLILNRPTPKTIKDVWQAAFHESSDWAKTIHLGGPVTGPLTALHASMSLCDGIVLPGLCSSLDPDKLKQIVAQQLEPTRFFANYSSWGPGQLEGELAENAWLTMPAKFEHVFCENPYNLWHEVIGQIEVQGLSRALKSRCVPRDPATN